MCLGWGAAVRVHNLAIIRGTEPGTPLVGGGCCTIGNFDGVHRGHQRILDTVTEAANRHSLPHRVVVTFFLILSSFSVGSLQFDIFPRSTNDARSSNGTE